MIRVFLRPENLALFTIVVLVFMPLFSGVALLGVALLGVMAVASLLTLRRWQLNSLSLMGLLLVLFVLYIFARSSLAYGIDQTVAQIDRHIPVVVVALIALGLSQSLGYNVERNQHAAPSNGAQTIPPLVRIGRLSALCMIITASYYTLFKSGLYSHDGIDLFGLSVPLPFVNKLLAAQLWVSGGFLSLMGLSQRPKLFDRLCALAGYVAALYAVSVLASSRGPTLVLALHLPLVIAYLTMPRKATLPQVLRVLVIAGGIGLIILLIGVWVLWTTQPGAFLRFMSIVDVLTSGRFEALDQSSNERLQMYAASLQVFWQHPLFGTGLAERFDSIRPYLSAGFPSYTHLHNFFFNQLVDGGLIGLGLFLGPIVCLWWQVRRKLTVDYGVAVYAVTLPLLALGTLNSILHTAETGTQFLLSIAVISWILLVTNPHKTMENS